MPESRNEILSAKKTNRLDPMTMSFEFAMQLLHKKYGLEFVEKDGALNLRGPFESVGFALMFHEIASRPEDVAQFLQTEGYWGKPEPQVDCSNIVEQKLETPKKSQ